MSNTSNKKNTLWGIVACFLVSIFMWGQYFYLAYFKPDFFELYPSKRYSGVFIGTVSMACVVWGLIARRKRKNKTGSDPNGASL